MILIKALGLQADLQPLRGLRGEQLTASVVESGPAAGRPAWTWSGFCDIFNSWVQEVRGFHMIRKVWTELFASGRFISMSSNKCQ